ncbi:hypothetical protein [Nocardia brevicatena]|uniref:hypothetical protein n=1 Tax=Nocardia brevicatena TaxID=37327 RepID=UPI0002D5013C|nr:hypothetical protein [Nocardia brevicatena]
MPCSGRRAAISPNGTTERRAEQLATDYAVGAATVDYQGPSARSINFEANTTPQPASKFDAIAPKPEQIRCR